MDDTNSTLKTESYTLRKDHHNKVLSSDREDRAELEYERFNSFADLEKFTHINRSGMNNISYKITADSQPEENVRHLKVELPDF